MIVLSESELISISSLNMNELANLVNRLCRPYGAKAPDRAMDLVRGIQVALTAYTRRHPKMDRVKEKSLVIIRKIEKWVYLDFMKNEMRSVQRLMPNATKAMVKQVARANWELYYKGKVY